MFSWVRRVGERDDGGGRVVDLGVVVEGGGKVSEGGREVDGRWVVVESIRCDESRWSSEDGGLICLHVSEMVLYDLRRLSSWHKLWKVRCAWTVNLAK